MTKNQDPLDLPNENKEKTAKIDDDLQQEAQAKQDYDDDNLPSPHMVCLKETDILEPKFDE